MDIRKLITYSAFASTLVFAQQSGSTGNSGQSGQSGSGSTAQSADRTSEGNRSGTSAQAGHSGQHSAGQHSGTGAATLGRQDHHFMMEAARGGMMEVQVAQMAQQKAASDEVKQYARQLEQDHSKANEKLKAIAQERGVQLPSDLGPHQAMVSQLNNLSGEEFDRQFMKMQVQHHKKDINQFRKQTKSSMDSDLREFASSNLPTLEQHLRQAQTLASQTGTRGRKR
jgi:putative membrane protein